MLPDIWVQIDVCWILLQGQQRTPVHQYVRYCHKVTTLCSVYQARSFEPSRALQAPFSTELIYVSMLFILDIASTMQKPRKWSELRLIWLCWIYWTQCYYFCASIDFNISDLEEWGVHFVQRGSIWLTFCIHKDYTTTPWVWQIHTIFHEVASAYGFHESECRVKSLCQTTKWNIRMIHHTGHVLHFFHDVQHIWPGRLKEIEERIIAICMQTDRLFLWLHHDLHSPWPIYLISTNLRTSSPNSILVNILAIFTTSILLSQCSQLGIKADI